jgi:hypothetical protein
MVCSREKQCKTEGFVRQRERGMGSGKGVGAEAHVWRKKDACRERERQRANKCVRSAEREFRSCFSKLTFGAYDPSIRFFDS